MVGEKETEGENREKKLPTTNRRDQYDIIAKAIPSAYNKCSELVFDVLHD